MIQQSLFTGQRGPSVADIKQYVRERLAGLCDRQRVRVARRRRAPRPPCLDVQTGLFDDAYVDERGVTWTRPTAWAYAQVCAALEQAKQRIKELEGK